MFDVNVLEFGYSLKSERHFIKFLIKGIDKENTEKLVGIISQILKAILNVLKPKKLKKVCL
jgi:hypothetical protein